MWDNRKRKLPAALLQREQPDTQLRRAGPGQGADLGTAPGSLQRVPPSPWFSAVRPPSACPHHASSHHERLWSKSK